MFLFGSKGASCIKVEICQEYDLYLFVKQCRSQISDGRVFPYFITLAMSAFLYCLNLKKKIEKEICHFNQIYNSKLYEPGTVAE